mgnify:CR=1 FL=1
MDMRLKDVGLTSEERYTSNFISSLGHAAGDIFHVDETFFSLGGERYYYISNERSGKRQRFYFTVDEHKHFMQNVACEKHFV